MAKGSYKNDRSVSSWRQSQDSKDISFSSRTERRVLKLALDEMRKRIIDKWWWDSLTSDEKNSAHTYWTYMGYNEESLKKDIPGCLNTKRDLKINLLLKS